MSAFSALISHIKNAFKSKECEQKTFYTSISEQMVFRLSSLYWLTDPFSHCNFSALRTRCVLVTVCQQVWRTVQSFITPQNLLSSTNQIPQFVPEFLPHQAVNNRVQAAVGVRQTHGQWEHVCVDYVVRFVPVCRV